MKYGHDFIFSELAHGIDGLAVDYSQILGLETQQEIAKALHLMSLKKRIANKKACPCGCGYRLGKCKLRLKLNQFRKMTSRSWLSGQYKDFVEQMKVDNSNNAGLNFSSGKLPFNTKELTGNRSYKYFQIR